MTDSTGPGRRTPLLDLSEASFRRMIERRSEYAKTIGAGHVEFQRYSTTGLVDGVPVWTEAIGQLQVPTGTILAADPFYLGVEFTRPFARRIPRGVYPVLLTFTDLSPWKKRVAFATLRIREMVPSRWELAVTDEENAFNEFYGVDSGMGTFADAEGAAQFVRSMEAFSAAHPDGNYYDDVLQALFSDHEDWCEFEPPGGGPNVLVFSSGFGDGAYASYWGLDESGEACCLLTDFQAFDPAGSIARV